jgi:tetratricopeptide (TPR) repeat protein
MKKLLMLSLFLAIGLTANSQSDNIDYEKTLNLAVSFFENGRLAESRTAMLKILDDYRKAEVQFSKDLYLGQPLSDAQLDRFVQKSVYAQKANFYIGQIELSNQNPYEAIAYFKASLELDSADVNALSGVGDGYLMIFKLPKAIEYYSYSINSKPNTYSYLKRASVLTTLKLYKLAIDDLDKAIALSDDCLVCIHNRGYSLLLDGQFKKSIQDFDKVLANDGEDSYALNNKAMALFKLGEAKKALQLIDKALIADKSNYYAMRNRAIIFYTQGKKDLACKEIDKSVKSGLEIKYDKEILDILNSCK